MIEAAGGKVGDVRSRLEDRVRAHDQVDAGGDHRRRVDEGRDGGRALHRVGQPHVQRDEPGLEGHAERAFRTRLADAGYSTLAIQQKGKMRMLAVATEIASRDRGRRVRLGRHHGALRRSPGR